MAAVDAKSEAEKIGLFGVAAEAVVGEIAEFVGGEIHDGEGLFFAGGVGAVAAVEEDGEAPVGRDCGGGGEIVRGAWVAGNFAEKFCVGHLERSLGAGLRLGEKRG